MSIDKNFNSFLTISLLLLFGCLPGENITHTATAKADYSRDSIRTLLPFDAIPAIRNPQFVAPNEAKLGDNAPVIGVSFNGEQHAYSIFLLNGHEIVNDVVGGIKIATTW